MPLSSCAQSQHPRVATIVDPATSLRYAQDDGSSYTDIKVLTPSDSIAEPAPRATTTPRSITT